MFSFSKNFFGGLELIKVIYFFVSLLMIIFKVRLLWRPWICVKEGHEFIFFLLSFFVVSF